MIRVTIVGAGHYARSIVSRKYAESAGCTLLGVISPRTSAERLYGTPLHGLPLVRSAAEWRGLHGPPTEHDVFDLCIHPDAILAAMRPLVEIGARTFVLPKPLATTRAGLDELVRFIRGSDLRVAVASQWHYSTVTGKLSKAVGSLVKPLCVEADFSQCFSSDQLRHYTPYTALLPHMLQILHSTGLWRHAPGDRIMKVDEAATRLQVRVVARAGGEILLHTDLETGERRRVIAVEDAAGHRVAADFLGVFRDGIAEKYPAIETDGRREEILEDNIAVMVRQHIACLLDEGPYLDLDRYLPVNDTLVTIRG